MVRNFSRSTAERTSDCVQTNGNDERNASKPPANIGHVRDFDVENRLIIRRISLDVFGDTPFASYRTISLNRSTRDM